MFQVNSRSMMPCVIFQASSFTPSFFPSLPFNPYHSLNRNKSPRTVRRTSPFGMIRSVPTDSQNQPTANGELKPSSYARSTRHDGGGMKLPTTLTLVLNTSSNIPPEVISQDPSTQAASVAGSSASDLSFET